MRYTKLLPALFAASIFIVASDSASAQTRAVPRGGSAVIGQAVPRSSAPAPRPLAGRPIVVAPRFGGYAPYRPYYRSSFTFGFFAGYPYYPYGYYAYPSPYAYPQTTYIVAGPARPSYGSVRIVGAPREAQVFADGYYVGTVDDFDGAYQHLNLSPGPHHIEVRAGGQPIEFDVRIQPGQTITYRAE